jgi:nucleotide-binding universal stress UspA family protein
MTDVLAVVSEDEDPTLVAEVSAAIAEVVGAGVTTLELPHGTERPAGAQAVVDRLGEPGNAVATLRAGADSEALSWTVLQQVSKPVVLVPPEDRFRSHPIGRALVPLDGSRESAAAVARTVQLLTRAGVDVIVLHVFQPGSVPPFWDHPTHAAVTWQAEFLARNCAQRGVRMELRNGAPDENVVDVARSENVDLIALGWSQKVSEGRAPTVRSVVADAPVPVMLVPVGLDG